VQEAEEYIRGRERGQGRRKASRVFSGDRALSTNHPAVLDKAFRRAVNRAKALFHEQVDNRLSGFAWIQAITGGDTQHPIVSLNQYCLEHKVNCVCLIRFPILLFRAKKPNMTPPHNNGAPRSWKVVIDSW
jgi:hypothetical protein